MLRALVLGTTILALAPVADADRAGAAGPTTGTPVGQLDIHTIDNVIEQQDRAIQACHRQSRHDTLAVQLMLEIDPAGAVTAAQPLDRVTPAAQCLARIAKRLRFPATGVATRIAYPFMLLPR